MTARAASTAFLLTTAGCQQQAETAADNVAASAARPEPTAMVFAPDHAGAIER